MTEQEFLNHAEALLQSVESCCDQINETSDADVDNQRTGNMVTLTFPNRSQIVVNLQKPLHEVWMAALSGGFHFRFDGTSWQDTKGTGEFFACLSQNASAQAGRSLAFAAAKP